MEVPCTQKAEKIKIISGKKVPKKTNMCAQHQKHFAKKNSHPPPTLTPTGLGFVREDKSIQLMGTKIMDKDECTAKKIWTRKNMF